MFMYTGPREEGMCGNGQLPLPRDKMVPRCLLVKRWAGSSEHRVQVRRGRLVATVRPEFKFS